MNRRSAPPRQVRIIGGQWKRTPLPVIDAEGLRPTPDRVRETLFNWLDHLLDRDWHARRCLDLFAGSGALGFEAASRGAAAVLMVEALPSACKVLQATRDKLNAAQVEIRRSDALPLLGSLAVVEGLQHMVGPLVHKIWHVEPQISTPYTRYGFAAFLFLVLHVRPVRRVVFWAFGQL